MSDFLAHYGVPGQKWGVRRYQYQDGSYTPEGRIHYGIGDGKGHISSNISPGTTLRKQINDKLETGEKLSKKETKVFLDDRKKKLLTIGAIGLGIGLIAVAGYAAYNYGNLETGLYINGAVRRSNIAQELRNNYSYMYDSNTKSFDLPDDEDFLISAGKKLYRMAKTDNPIDSLEKSLYVSNNQLDRQIYKSYMDKFAGQKGYKYEHTFTATQDIKAPSLKNTLQIFSDLLNDPKIMSDIHEIGDDLDGLTRKEISAKYYPRLNTAMTKGADGNWLAYAKTITAFREALMKNGYNAIMDINDQGAISKTPMILLDPNSTISRDSVKKVNELEKILGALLIPRSYPKTIAQYNRDRLGYS